MPALNLTQFAEAVAQGAIPLDLRLPEQFAEKHVPGSVFLQFGSQDLGDRAELFLPKEHKYVIVMEPAALGGIAEKLMAQAGYSVAGFLQGGFKAWVAAGQPVGGLPTVTVKELHELLGRGESLHILDVRADFEYTWGHIGNDVNISHEEIFQRVGELDATQHWYIVCNSQQRSGAAASVLRRSGFEQLTLVYGGTAAWIEEGYELVKG